MKESGVGAFARGARRFALAAAALLVGAGSLHAQAAGKLEGRIRDQAGAPIAQAQVRVEGTAFGAVADNQGYYFINNVPAGIIDVVARFVGYKPVRVSGLRITAGQTITQDFTLEQTPVELEDITTVAAVNPLVPRDQVTTKQGVEGDYVETLPVDRISSVLALVPGVVVTGGGGLSIRGGRTDEAAVYVDGVPVSPGNRGSSDNNFGAPSAGTVDVSTVGFEEASITTGASSAEFGNAQSGILSLTTRAGGAKWGGSFGYENDEVTGTNSLGFNRLQFSVGGPIAGNLTLYLGGDMEGRKDQGTGINGDETPLFIPVGTDTTVSVIDGVDTAFVDVKKYAIFKGQCDEFDNSVNSGIKNNYGYDCQGARTPWSAASSYRTNGKLQYTFGAGNKVSFSAIRSQGNTRTFSYGSAEVASRLLGTVNTNNSLILNWTQNLSKSADRALALDVYGSYQWDESVNGPLNPATEQDTRDPMGGFIIKPLDLQFDFDNFDIENMEDNFRANAGRLSPYDIKDNTQYQAVDEFRNNPYGLQGAFTTFFDRGGNGGRSLNMYQEKRWIGKANLDWQVDRYNRVKVGGEYTKFDMLSYASGLTSQAFSNAYNESPTRYNLFLEDRLDLGDVVLVAGLRYDWYKSGASRPYYTDPVTGEKSWFPRISTMPGFDPTDPKGSFESIAVEDKSHDYLSPHVQVAFPVTDRTNFRLSYAHQVQAPDFGLILRGINTDLSVTNTNHTYGSDLDFGKSITFEFGIRHSFNDDMVLDLSAYNTDKLSDAAGRLLSYYDPLKLANVDIRVITNADFGNTRGVNLRFDRRIGELFNGTLAYTFEDSKNTGSDPFSYINFGSRILNALGGGNAPPPQAILNTNNSRPHTLAGQLALSFPDNWKQGNTAGSILENVGLFATFRFASGLAYTRCPVDVPEDDNVFAQGVCSKDIEGEFNGARLPSQKQFDLRITKGFGFGRLDFTAYADIRNLFNFENINTVFAQTNDITNSRERDKIRTSELQSFASEGTANGVYQTDGSLDLSFGTGGCGGWVDTQGESATPNCIYMIRGEERFGNGDGIFTEQEQTKASDALYNVFRDQASFTGAPRRVRLGFEVN
ncbi:MAG: TonB-dependent receptor, partial [Gemmatimonadota bacterium]|nr:TonB-dependent receptor [Gemmatimonadota bacterium]